MRVVYFIATLLLFESALCEDGKGQGYVDDNPEARRVFNLADQDNSSLLTRTEFHLTFLAFDVDGDGNVTSTEFIKEWQFKDLGTIQRAVQLFLNLDVNDDTVINEAIDIPWIFKWFDRNGDDQVSDGEFVIQWVKLSV